MKTLILAIKKGMQFLMRQFIGRAGIIMAGTILGQGIAFLCIPLIARFYQADVIGRAATTIAIINILSMINCLQYDQAIIVSSEEDLIGVVKISLLINTGMNALLFGFIVISPLVFSQEMVGFSQSIGFTWELPLLSSVYSMFLVITNFYLRKNSLFKVSLARVIYYGGGSIAQVVAGTILGGSEIVYLIAQFAACLIVVIILFPNDLINSCRDSGSREEGFSSLVHKYANFPRYQLGAAFVNSIGAQFPVFFMRLAFSETWSGYFFMAWRILAAPVTLISQAFGQVLFRDSAENERDGASSATLIEQTAVNLLRISFLPSLAFGISSHMVIKLLLGADWLQVGTMIRYLIIGILITFVVSPLSPVLTVKNKQQKALVFNIILFMLKAVGLLIGWGLGSAMNSVLLFSIATLIGMTAFLVAIFRDAGSSIKAVLAQVGNIVFGGTAVVSLLVINERLSIISKNAAGMLGIVLLIFLGSVEFLRGRKREIISD